MWDASCPYPDQSRFRGFMEPDVLIATDPSGDAQAVNEAVDVEYQ